MDVQLSFPDKPKTDLKSDAIRIAKDYGAKFEKGRCIASFNNFNKADDRLMSLLRICGSIKGARLFVDNQEYKIRDSIAILNCLRKEECDGICEYHSKTRNFRYAYLLRTIEWAARQSRWFYYKDHRDAEIEEYVKKSDESTLVVDKQRLQDAVLEEWKIPLLVCRVCSMKNILAKINLLPETIPLVEHDDEPADKDEDEDGDENEDEDAE